MSNFHIRSDGREVEVRAFSHGVDIFADSRDTQADPYAYLDWDEVRQLRDYLTDALGDARPDIAAQQEVLAEMAAEADGDVNR